MDFYCLACAVWTWAVPFGKTFVTDVQLGHAWATWQGTAQTLAALSAQKAGVSTFG